MKHDKNDVLRRAFTIACRFLREHPPHDTCAHVELVSLVYDAKSDPDGVRWAQYFVQRALDELNEV